MSEDMAHKPFSFVEQKRCIRSQGAKIFFLHVFNKLLCFADFVRSNVFFPN